MAEAVLTLNRVGVGGLCVCVSASVSLSVCVGSLLSSQDDSIVTESYLEPPNMGAAAS